MNVFAGHLSFSFVKELLQVLRLWYEAIYRKKKCTQAPLKEVEKRASGVNDTQSPTVVNSTETAMVQMPGEVGFIIVGLICLTQGLKKSVRHAHDKFYWGEGRGLGEDEQFIFGAGSQVDFDVQFDRVRCTAHAKKKIPTTKGCMEHKFHHYIGKNEYPFWHTWLQATAFDSGQCKPVRVAVSLAGGFKSHCAWADPLKIVCIFLKVFLSFEWSQISRI